MKSVNPTATRDIIAEGDENEKPEDQTRFELTQLTVEEFAYLQDLAGAHGTFTMAALSLGLSGAKGLYDPSGNPVQFKRDESKRPIVGKKKQFLEPCLSYIPPRERDRLAAIIFKGVGIEEDEAKNS